MESKYRSISLDLKEVACSGIDENPEQLNLLHNVSKGSFVIVAETPAREL